MRYFCVATAAVSAILSLGIAVAYPSGAGTCKNGPAVLGSDSPHLESDQFRWSESGYKIKFNENDLILEAEGDGNYFRGFLLRLSHRNGTAVGVMKRHSDFRNISQRLDSTGASVGLQATCAEGVVGICHTDRSKKTEIAVKLFPEQDTVYRLSVTVVKQEDEWYYTTMRVGLLADDTIGIISDGDTSNNENVPAKAPTSSPTSSPTVETTLATTGTSSPAGETSSGSPSPAPVPTTTTGRGSESLASQVQSTSAAVHEKSLSVLVACTVLLMCTFMM